LDVRLDGGRDVSGVSPGWTCDWTEVATCPGLVQVWRATGRRSGRVRSESRKSPITQRRNAAPPRLRRRHQRQVKFLTLQATIALRPSVRPPARPPDPP